MSSRKLLALGLFAAAAAFALLLSGVFTSQAVQNPTLSIDMVTSGNTYTDTTNTMNVGSIENCLTTAPPGNAAQHLHTLHIIVQNVEDVVGWQVRLNYLGDRFRPNTVSFTPFADTNTGQNISFVNLPIDQVTAIHRDVLTASSIPPSAPGSQTAAFGSTYIGAQNFPISPDTPAKAISDDSSYSAPSGGVLAAFTASVVGNQQGQPSLFLNMDDASPNGPGSGFAVFDGVGTVEIEPPPASLGDGYHGEGATCVPLDCGVPECPAGTPPPSPTPPPPTPSPTSPTPTPPPPQPSDPRISLDMVPSGNTYDDATNSMTVGSIENCLTSATANPNTHIHTVHLVIENVNDLVGWQARMNFLGDRFRVNTVGFAPFLDSTTAQNVSFLNLPLDQTTGVHRDLIFNSNIPPGAPGPQTAVFGATYGGTQNFAVSPDTPPKSPPDDTSYSAPSGGVLASMNLQVVGDESGQPSLFMNLDDNSPNPIGTEVVVFTGSGIQTMPIPVDRLGDGYHGEGATCVPLNCVVPECPPATSPTPPPPTPTPTPGPAAGHDARLTRIGGVPKNVRLSPGEVINDSASVVVANQSNHAQTIGVYVDVMAPSGCTPNGRVLETTVLLAAGAKTTVPVPVSYSCADVSAANGQSYTWTAVADHGADDLASCGAGSLQGLTCFNALANDDEDPADNRMSRTGPKVIAQ